MVSGGQSLLLPERIRAILGPGIEGSTLSRWERGAMVPVEVELQHIFGYAFSLLAGHWATNRIIGLVDIDESLSTKLLGFVERTLYTTSVVIGQWGFFPVWLGLKVAPEVVRKWGEKPGDDGIESGIERQRRYFNRWLTGTGISLRCMVSWARR